MRLDPPRRKPDWYIVLFSPELLRLLIYLMVMLSCMVVLALLMTTPLPSIQGGW